MGQSMGDPVNRRQHPRVKADLQIRVAQRDLGTLLEANALNLSKGGIFVASEKHHPIGTILRFEIKLIDEETVLRGTGEVKWTRTRKGVEGVPAGMGVEFRMLDEASQRLVDRLVEEGEPEPTPAGAKPIDSAKLGKRPVSAARPVRIVERRPAEVDKRVHPRVMSGIAVRLQFSDVDEFLEGNALNISRGGIFLRTRKPCQLGSVIQFDLLLSGGESLLKGTGKVVWVATPAGPGEAPRVPGIGVRFLDLDQASKETVDQIVSQGIAHRKAAQAGRPGESAITISGAESIAGSEAAPEAEPATEPDLKLTALREAEAAALVKAMNEPVAEDLAAQREGARPEALESLAPVEIPIEVQLTGRAAELEGLGRSKWLVDSLVTSLELAQLPVFEDTSTVHYLLGRWCPDFFDGQLADLTMFWNLLLGEEELSLKDAALPLMIFAQAADQHGFVFELPEGLLTLEGLEGVQGTAARRLQAGGLGFASRVALVEAREPVASTQEPERYDGTPVVKSAGSKKKTKKSAGMSASRKKLIAWVGMALAAGGLAFTAWSFWPHRAMTFDLAPVADLIKLERSQRKGERLLAHISDPAWFELDEGERRSRLESLATRLDHRGIRWINLFDSQGNRCASLHLPGVGEKAQIRIGAELYAPPSGLK